LLTHCAHTHLLYFRSQFHFSKINAEFKRQKNFVNEVETQYEKNHSRAAKPRISIIKKTRLVTK